MTEHDMYGRLDRCSRAALYHRTSWEYLEAYSALASEHPEDFGALTSPKLFLLCHALEVAMKGWLVLREGVPADITQELRRALRQAGREVPKTLKNYSHDLAAIAEDAGQYHPALLAYMDTLKHLTKSYWGDDDVASLGHTRDYEYPEGNHVMSYVAPSEFAKLVTDCSEALLEAANQERQVVGEALGLKDDE